MGHDNPAYGQTNSIPGNEPEYIEIGELQQRDIGFHNPHFDPWDHYQSLANANGRSDNVYAELNLSGIGSQSEA